jgi:hypothetical protein
VGRKKEEWKTERERETEKRWEREKRRRIEAIAEVVQMCRL